MTLIIRNVFPGYREVMVLENTHPMLGTCGTLSWQLVEINLRLIVMWRYHDNDDRSDGGHDDLMVLSSYIMIMMITIDSLMIMMVMITIMTIIPVFHSTSTSATRIMQ